jgi:hypothetical protein
LTLTAPPIIFNKATHQRQSLGRIQGKQQLQSSTGKDSFSVAGMQGRLSFWINLRCLNLRAVFGLGLTAGTLALFVAKLFLFFRSSRGLFDGSCSVIAVPVSSANSRLFADGAAAFKPACISSPTTLRTSKVSFLNFVISLRLS